MARFHLRFRDFHMDTIEATTGLFDSKPWRMEDSERLATAQAWLDAVCPVYNVPFVRLVIGEHIESDPHEIVDALGDFEDEFDDGVEDDPLAFHGDESDEDTVSEELVEDQQTEAVDLSDRPVMQMDHWSILLLFKRFREHLLENGYTSVNKWRDDDVHGWACSLFYKVRPVMFRKRVREGRIGRIHPDELLSTETLRQRQEDEQQTAEARARAEMEASRDAEFEDIDLDAEIEAEFEGADDASQEGFNPDDLPVSERQAQDFTDDGEAQEAAYGDTEGDFEPSPTLTYLLGKSRDEVRAIAKENNVPRGSMNKEELARAIVASGYTL